MAISVALFKGKCNQIFILKDSAALAGTNGKCGLAQLEKNTGTGKPSQLWGGVYPWQKYYWSNTKVMFTLLQTSQIQYLLHPLVVLHWPE